jgi:hypothetical protein
MIAVVWLDSLEQPEFGQAANGVSRRRTPQPEAHQRDDDIDAEGYASGTAPGHCVRRK